MPDSDDLRDELEADSHAPETPGASHLRAASGAVFVALLPWVVAGYLLFSWAGQSIGSVFNSYGVFIGVAAIALGAFSLWQVVIAVRHLLAWMTQRRG